MNLIRPRVEVLDIGGATPVMPRLEACGRTAYKSEDRIGPGTAEKFIQSIIKRGHLSVVEHHRFVMFLPARPTPLAAVTWMEIQQIQDRCEGLVTDSTKEGIFLSVNARTVIEAVSECMTNHLAAEIYRRASREWPPLFPLLPKNSWEDLPLRILSYEEVLDSLVVSRAARLLPMTLKFVVDRGVSHELVRHRKMSFTQESTRYVNYGKASSCTFIIPEWAPHVKEGEVEHVIDVGRWETDPVKRSGLINWAESLLHSEQSYLGLVGDYNKWTPQQARSVLPNSTKTEVVVTGTLDRWRTLLGLRVADGAHPQAAEVAVPALQWLQSNPVFESFFSNVKPGDKWKTLRTAMVEIPTEVPYS